MTTNKHIIKFDTTTYNTLDYFKSRSSRLVMAICRGYGWTWLRLHEISYKKGGIVKSF